MEMWRSSLAPGGGVDSKKSQSTGVGERETYGTMRWMRPGSWRKHACCGGGGEDRRESDKDNGAKGQVVSRHFQNIFCSYFIYCDKNLVRTVELNKKWWDISIYFWREPTRKIRNLFK